MADTRHLSNTENCTQEDISGTISAPSAQAQANLWFVFVSLFIDHVLLEMHRQVTRRTKTTQKSAYNTIATT